MADKTNIGFNVYLDDKTANASLKTLQAEARKLKNELATLSPKSQEFIDKSKQFQLVQNRLKGVTDEINGTGSAFSKLATWFNKYQGMFFALSAAFVGIGMTIKKFVSTAAELSDELADIRKTTGMTQVEVEKLNSEFKKIDTRTSREELRKMAIVAGQLGIAKKDIFAFVESVDKLNVALGDEFKGGAEEVATKMGTLRNVLTDMKTSNIADDMLKIGNAINQLAAAGFATGPVVTDFANRIAGIGIPLGLTSGQVLGLSATLQELNVHTERGGTAVARILQKMTTNVGTFAKIAGMNIVEFKNLLNTDLYSAFIKVMEGSKNSGSSATDLAEIIKELEVQGAGAAEVFAKLGSNTAILREKVDMANTSLKGTDSIMNEFNIKNETLGAVLNKLGKYFMNLVTLPGVQNFFKSIILKVYELTEWMKRNVETLKILGESFLVFLSTLTAYKIAVFAASAFTKTFIAIKTAWRIINLSLALSYNYLTGNINRANAAMRLLNITTKASPFGIITSILTAAIGVFMILRNKIDETTKAQEEFRKTLIESQSEADSLFEQLKKSNPGTGERLFLINEINSKYGEYIGNMLTEESTLQDIQKAQENVNKELLKGIAIKAKIKEITELVQAENELKKEVMEMGKDWREVFNNRIFVDDKGITHWVEYEGKLATIVGVWDQLQRKKKDVTSFYNDIMKDFMENGETTNPTNKKKSKQNYQPDSEDDPDKKEVKKLNDLNDEIKKIKAQQLEYTMSENEKEIYEVKLKYNSLFESAKGHKKQIKELEYLYSKEIENIQNKQLAEQEKKAVDAYNALKKKIIETAAEVSKGLLDENNKEISDVNDKYAELFQAAEGHDAEMLQLTQLYYTELDTIIKKQDEKKKQKEEKETEENKKKLKKEQEDKVAAIQDSLNSVSSMVQELNDLEDYLANKRLDQINTEKEAKLAALDDLYNKKLISDKEYNTRKAKVEAEYHKKSIEQEKKAAKQKAQITLMLMLLNSAVSIANAIKVATDSSKSWIEMIAAILASVATVGASMYSAWEAYDKANSIQLNSGGKVPGSGNTDTVPAMLTPGEYVLNKKAVSAIGLPLLNHINYQIAPNTMSAVRSSRAENGYSEGGQVNNTSKPDTDPVYDQLINVLNKVYSALDSPKPSLAVFDQKTTRVIRKELEGFAEAENSAKI